MKKIIAIGFILIGVKETGFAQTVKDKTLESKWTNHFQFTIIAQKHLSFRSLYNGANSLADTVEPAAESITATLFLGRRLWKGGVFYFNPETSGGRGLSSATGVAGALNGETYRVGGTEPHVFIARAYVQQNFPLDNTTYKHTADDLNQLACEIPESRITISAGKFAISDFYDDNKYSKNPRTQFLNWSLWANGAWDYPANTRGYTMGVIAELLKPKWAIRLSSVAVPRIANAPKLEYRINKAHSETFEFQHSILLNKKEGTIRIIINSTHSKAPSYAGGLEAIHSNNAFLLGVMQGKAEGTTYGGKKFGIGYSFDQELTNEIGIFSRAGWNDGKCASWAFTEIDQTFSIGLSVKGNAWKRPDDVLGIATVVNGISNEHRAFLKAGGYGFIIGDGTLDYGHESILESFYSARLSKFFWLSFDYQFVNNPAYNKDRGPVHVFGIRGHVEF